MRRTTIAGYADVLGRHYLVDAGCAHRLVRAELDFDTRMMLFHALRRREPADQPPLAEVPCCLPVARTRW